MLNKTRRFASFVFAWSGHYTGLSRHRLWYRTCRRTNNKRNECTKEISVDTLGTLFEIKESNELVIYIFFSFSDCNIRHRGKKSSYGTLMRVYESPFASFRISWLVGTDPLFAKITVAIFITMRREVELDDTMQRNPGKSVAGFCSDQKTLWGAWKREKEEAE